MARILTPTGWRNVTVNTQRVQGFKIFNEELDPTQINAVRKWPRDPKAIAATNHYFGANNNVKNDQLEDTQNKSEVHKEVEKHLNQPIHVNDYRGGKIKDKYGRDVKLGAVLQKTKAAPALVNKFANDSTRQGTKFAGLHVHVTRSPEGVAGQTSGNQSWANTSCKHFSYGSENHYLKNEVKHGTVASYLKDHSGKELARATLQPHINKKGDTAYRVTSHYGIDHAGFKDHAEKLATKLSHQTGDKTEVYKIHHKVHNDSEGHGGEVIKHILHPHLDHNDIHKIVDNEKESTHINNRRRLLNLALNHPNADHTHFDKVLSSKNVHSSTLSTIGIHKNANAGHLHKILNVPTSNASNFKYDALTNKNIDHSHITKALNDVNVNLRRAALQHPNANADHISKGLHDKIWTVRATAIGHRNATADHITKALSDNHSNVRHTAIRHLNANVNHISKGLKDEDPRVRIAAAKHSNATADHISKAMNDKDSDVRIAVAKRKQSDVPW